MIVANERGFSERGIDSAIVGEGFFLIIVMSGEIGQLQSDRRLDVLSHLKTRLYPGGRLIIADSSEGIGGMPKGTRQHSWVTPDEEV